MAAHKRERKQAAVKVEFGFHVELEMDSRWNWGSLFTLGRCPRFTGLRVYVVLVLRWDVGTLGRWDGFTVEAGDWVTLRGC